MKRKLSPRHYKEDKFDTKRAVLSYEQLPLDDYEPEDKANGEKKSVSYKKLIIAVVIILVLVTVVFVVLNRFSFAGCVDNSVSSSDFSVTLKGSLITNGNFNTYSEGFAYVSDTHYVVCDNNGAEKFNSQVSFNNPVMKLNYNGSSIVYDLGATSYSVYSDTELLFCGETDTNMYLADVTPEYAYATVTESRDYKAKLSVFGTDKNPLYAYSFEEYYITAMSLSPDATGAVACGITTENGTEKSVVYVFDFTEEKPLAFYEFPKEVIYDCEYISDGSICVMGESSSYIISGRKYDKLTKNSYSQMTLTSYDFNSDTGVLFEALSRSGDGRNCNLRFINASGKIENTVETELSASFISSYKNRIAISDGRKAYLYNESGELLSQKNLLNDSRQIRLISADKAIVLGLSEIYIVEF